MFLSVNILRTVVQLNTIQKEIIGMMIGSSIEVVGKSYTGIVFKVICNSLGL